MGFLIMQIFGDEKVGFIYMITNPDGLKYIGRTFDLKSRLNKYKNDRCKSQKGISSSIKEYGFDNHIFDILIKNLCTSEELDELEIFYIKKYDTYNNGLNRTKGGKGALGLIVSEERRNQISKQRKGNKASCETKALMSINRKGKSKPLDFGKKVSNRLKGVKKSELHCSNISKSKKGKPGRPHDKKFIDRMSLGNNPRAKKVIHESSGHIYNSVLEASIAIGIPRTTLSCKINGYIKNDTGFKYLDK